MRQQQQQPLPQDEGAASLSELLRVLWGQKILISGIAGFVSFIFVFLAGLRPVVFSAEARILFEHTHSPRDPSIRSWAPRAAAEIEVFKSRPIANRVIANPNQDPLGLGLVFRIDDEDRYSVWNSTLPWRRFSPSGGLTGHIVGPVPAQGGPSGTLFFTGPKNATFKFARLGGENHQDIFLTDDGFVDLGGVRLQLFAEGDLTGRTFRLKWVSPRQAVEDVLARLSVQETSPASGVLRATLKDSDPVRAAITLNHLVDAYVHRFRERLALRTTMAVGHTDEQIKAHKAQLEAAEKKLIDFQESSGAFQLSHNGLAAVQRIAALDLEKAKLALIDENQAQFLRGLDLEGEHSDNSLGFGANLGPFTLEMLQKLSRLVAEERILAKEHSEGWPPLSRLNFQISDLRNSIFQAAAARKQSLEKQLQSLELASENWRRQIGALPVNERVLATLHRRAHSLEQMYIHLLSEKQKARILNKSNFASVTIIDYAKPPIHRSSPKLALCLYIGITSGLALGVLIGLWRGVSPFNQRSSTTNKKKGEVGNKGGN